MPRPRFLTGKPAIFLIIAVAVVGLGVAGNLKKSSATPGATPDTPPPPVMTGFVNHQDPGGFTLQRPEDWQVSARSLADIVITSPNSSAAAAVRARVVRGDLTRYLAEDYLRSEAGARNVQVLESSAQSPDVAHAVLGYSQGGTIKRASLVAVRRGEIATIFVAMASADSFNAELPRMAQILESFRFNAPATPTGREPQSTMRFVRWTEPNEQAFSFEVPAGWQMQGGLLRRVEGVRSAWQATSPDGAVMLFGGDAQMPAYFVFPTQTAISLGNREGYPTGPNGPIMLRFQDARAMGQMLLKQRFGSVQITGDRERGDLVNMLRRNPAMPGSLSRMSGGELEFRLNDGRIGTIMLTTYGQEMPDLGGTWYVDNILGFIAPADRAAEAGMALARSIGTSQENPNWRQGEAAHQQQMSAQYQEYATWSRNLQQQAIETRWASDENRQAGMREILGGTVRLKDPETGEVFETGGQSRYYYRVAGQDQGVGTDVDNNPVPEVDMRRLLRVGVETP
jgi:hypothetical protein